MHPRENSYLKIKKEAVNDISADVQKQNCIWEVKIDVLHCPHYISRMSVLSALELEKYNNYKNKKAQLTYLICRVALRDILGYYLLTASHNINIENGPYGKPFLKDIPNLYFNLSHSGSKALIIVSDSEVGIDIEHIDPNINYWEIANYCFSQEELKLIEIQQDRLQKCLKFFELWTQKEALLKGLGTGLMGDMKSTNLHYFNSSPPLNQAQEQWSLYTFTESNNQHIFSFAYKSSIKKQFLYDVYSPPLTKRHLSYDQEKK